MKTRLFAAAAAALSLTCVSAFAGPKDDATAHFQAIAAGHVDQIVAGYASGAVFQWVGGPLDGAYQGNDAIHGVWAKFAKANAPLTVKVEQLAESANPAGATVTANVTFSGKSTIKVRYVLTYRGGKLVNEIWQIDPKLASAY
jgi:hypothetical protein